MPLFLEGYLQWVDWTGRQVAGGRRGSIPADLPPLLARVGIAEADWLPLVTRFGRLFHRVAGGPHSLGEWTSPRPRTPRHRFRPGRAELLGPR